MADYRRGARRCPGCDQLLAEELHGQAHVDVCPSCQGIWIDWLDGDITSIAAEVGATGAPPAANERTGGSNRCPLCAHELSREILGHEAAVVWRCGSCVGAFVPHGSLGVIAGTAEMEDDEANTDPFLTRVLDAVGRFLLG